MSRRFPSAAGGFLAATSAITGLPLTMVVWVKPANQNMAPLWIGTQGLGTRNEHYVEMFAGSIYAQSVETDLFAASSIAGVTADEWNHAGGVYASATSRIAYLNGVAATENTTSRNPLLTEMFLGVLPGGGLPYNGLMAHAAVWNVALTPDEMLALGRRSNAKFPSEVRPHNLVGYWPLNTGLTPENDASGKNTLYGQMHMVGMVSSDHDEPSALRRVRRRYSLVASLRRWLLVRPGGIHA